MVFKPTSPSLSNSIRIEIVTTYEQLLHAYAIRSICFMEENGVKARHNFDGNDFQATHVLIYDADEPIGSVRIRWFSDFARFERMCFRKEYRNARSLKACAEYIFAHVARKGYKQVITSASPKYARLWRSLLGFRVIEGKEPVLFDGYDEPFIDLVRDLEPPSDAITIHSDTAVLYRVEGAWDRPAEIEGTPARS